MTDKVFNDEIDALKADIASLRDDIAKLADAVVGAADEKIKEARGNMNEQAREAVEEALDRGRRTLDDLDEHVREHPVGSLMTAFGIGLLIAMLLGSGGRR